MLALLQILTKTFALPPVVAELPMRYSTTFRLRLKATEQANK